MFTKSYKVENGPRAGKKKFQRKRGNPVFSPNINIKYKGINKVG